MKGDRIILSIVVALLAWGVVHAIGAYLFNRAFWDVLKAVVVLACVLVFVGFWLLLLRRRAARKSPVS